MNSENLKQKAREVNNLLTEYIVLHNHFLKSTGTFSSLFRKVDFGKLSNDAHSLLEKFQSKEAELEESVKQDGGDKEKQFAECLLSYTKALTETVNLLDAMYLALNKKANGEKLSFKEHSDNNKKYQSAIKVYVNQGNRLNILYHSL